MRIIGYTYDADIHCVDCAFNEAAVGVLKRQPPLYVGSDECGMAMDLVDREGNKVRPVYDIDERVNMACCGDCFGPLRETQP